MAGTLSIYVLDGEMENFVRLAAPELELRVTSGAPIATLILRAVADSATGETVGDTALFEGQASWLTTTSSFDAVIARIEIKGTTFTDIAFNFPKGNDAD